MKLKEVSVSNYRSIARQTRFAVGDLTTLIGPNNEGKSNLLRALGIGMQLIQRWSALPDRLAGKEELTGIDAVSFLGRGRMPRSGRSEEEAHGFNWSRDYPLQKQTIKGAQPTTLRFSFELDDAEVSRLFDATSLRNNGILPIELKLSRGSVSLGIVKPGRGAASHKAKAREIAKFISEGVAFVSIPAIRTSRQAQSLVNDLARIRLQTVARSEEYRQLAEEINALRRAAVNEIADELTQSVKRYLPAVDAIDIETVDISTSDAVADLVIDDGASTSIDSKGDGIKSLVSMALLQQLASERAGQQNIILAVDEPEAHLHSASVHELQSLFTQMSGSQQVILATHNPIFVNREEVRSNILVRANDAKPALNVDQIREAIGVQLHDNLDSAEKIVLVEGLTDVAALPFLLEAVDRGWREFVTSGRVVLKATKGVGKLKSHVQREKSTLCQIFVVVDGDAPGKQEAAKVIDEKLLPSRNIFALSDGLRKQSELEDLVEPAVYLSALRATFGRVFTDAHFKNRSRKWADNFETAATTLGIVVTPTTLDDAKRTVADAVQNADLSELVRAEARPSLEALSALIRGTTS
ncbi:ATP-dependent endonuclease [Homoserinimonas sp. OAct 916]|uniref:ATP-dependent nuclease n=1 Tax=Homoserinimonas sp. OAct 916 TaxID=2211450 RepID=UPI0013008DE8|nr:AAA family ATPase [Homoserinimonas sp. OAct 916]